MCSELLCFPLCMFNINVIRPSLSLSLIEAYLKLVAIKWWIVFAHGQARQSARRHLLPSIASAHSARHQSPSLGRAEKNRTASNHSFKMRVR